ncbi:MAG: DMT family transporter [Candidatus Bathyarchaeota archaeon]|nr:DMT family transporter [Candidatus Bathyarchaeota archaeon]
MRDKRRGILFAVSASLIFGISPVFIRLILDSVNIETANILLSSFANIMFVLLFVFSGGLLHFKAIFANLRKVALIGFVTSMAALFYAYGILVSGPTTAIFLLQLSTIFTILLGVAVLKEKFTRREGIGMLIAVVGVFVLAYGDLAVQIVGTLVLVGAALLNALASLLSKVYVRKISPVALAGGNSFFVFIFIFAYSLLLGKLNTVFPSTVYVYAVLGAVTGVVVSFILLYKAFEVYDVSKVATIMTAQPFLTAIWSFAILALVPTINQLAGGAMIVLGVVVLSLSKEK